LTSTTSPDENGAGVDHRPLACGLRKEKLHTEDRLTLAAIIRAMVRRGSDVTKAARLA